MTEARRQIGPGPFRAEQLHDVDRYELSDGQPIYCAPAGRDHADHSLIGSLVLATDPATEWAGVDAGYQADGGTLRAPDIAVGPAPERDGWIPGAPRLAVEYASRGQEPVIPAGIAGIQSQGRDWGLASPPWPWIPAIPAGMTMVPVGHRGATMSCHKHGKHQLKKTCPRNLRKGGGSLFYRPRTIIRRLAAAKPTD